MGTALTHSGRLFDDLPPDVQREWSDATFLAERDRLERQDEEDEVAWARDGPAVVEFADRWEGFRTEPATT